MTTHVTLRTFLNEWQMKTWTVLNAWQMKTWTVLNGWQMKTWNIVNHSVKTSRLILHNIIATARMAKTENWFFATGFNIVAIFWCVLWSQTVSQYKSGLKFVSSMGCLILPHPLSWLETLCHTIVQGHMVRQSDAVKLLNRFPGIDTKKTGRINTQESAADFITGDHNNSSSTDCCKLERHSW